MATILSGKYKTRGVMLNEHVGKILVRWAKILQCWSHARRQLVRLAVVRLAVEQS